MKYSQSREDRRDLMHEIDDELKQLEIGNQPNDGLTTIGEGILKRAEQQRRDIGGAYAVANRIRRASKLLIKAIRHGDYTKVDRYRRMFRALWSELKELDLPADIGWQHDSETAGEIVEADGFLDTIDFVRYDQLLDRQEVVAKVRLVMEKLWYRFGDPDCDSGLAELIEMERLIEETLDNEEAFAKLTQEEQKRYLDYERKHMFSADFPAWLAGIGDIAGELSRYIKAMKVRSVMEGHEPLTREEYKNLVANYLFVAQAIHEFLDQFETCYGKVINNSRQRGWRNTYRALLDRMAGLVERYTDVLGDLLMRGAE